MDIEIAEQFGELGLEPSAEVIAKSVELCISYHVDAVEFVEQWIAFSISNLNAAEPTVDYLKEFERKVFQSKLDKDLAGGSNKKILLPDVPANHSLSMEMEASSLAIYGIVNDESDWMGENDGVESVKANTTKDNEILDPLIVCRTPKGRSSLARTPARHNDAAFSPTGYCPITGTPRTLVAAPGSGKIVYTFGNPALINTAQWSSVNQPKIQVRQLLVHDGESLNNINSKYMFDNLLEKAEIVSDRIFQIGQGLCQTIFGSGAENYELSQVDVHSQNPIKTIGVIYCDHDGQLDSSSALLVGSDEMRCRTVRLNFSKTKSIGVFPGQIVMVAGMNPKGDIFMVDEIISERHLEQPIPPKFADQLSFVIAAGPYTSDNDLMYDPLLDLTAYLKDHTPDVLILVGPFLDADHKLITDNIALAETFESFFEKIIARVVEAIGSSTTILIVSSHKDVNADPVYPTPPFSIKSTYPNVHVLPDPSLVDLNGITIGITSTDIVNQLINKELAVNCGDKVKRVVNYLLNQGSFYPLNPPAEDEICFDSYLAYKYGSIARIPNILILPSDQKCFIRVVNGCLAINPGRLAGTQGGTFTRFIITPPEPKDEANVFNYVGCQVRKI